MPDASTVKVIGSWDARSVPWIVMISPAAMGPPSRVAPLITEVTTGGLPGSYFGERLITADAETGNPEACINVAVMVMLL